MKTEIVPATSEMIERLTGEAPAITVRAAAAVRGEEVIGVGGVYANESGWVMFSTLTDELRKDKRALVKLVRAVQRYIARCPMGVVATADPAIKGSDVLLEHMGFQRVQGDIYLWLN